MTSGIKLVCFDLNKTLISENTWLELNQAMGMTPEEDQALFDLYDRGKLTYIDWQKKLEEIYISRGKATREKIFEVIFNYTYLPGAKEAVRYLKESGYTLSLVSGSIDLLVARVAGELGIPHFAANNLFVFNKGGYLATLKCLGEDTGVKAIQLKDQCRSLGIEVTETACVGDGDNDIEIFKLSGHGITFRDSKIEQHAWRVIDSLDQIKGIL